jgi:predicted nucleotidyltransferase
MSILSEHPAVQLAEKQLKLHISRHLPKAQVWLFGSRARQKGLRRSDFDLAVDLGSETPESALNDFEESIRADTEIIYQVDVVNLRSVSTTLRANIQREGILWKN